MLPRPHHAGLKARISRDTGVPNIGEELLGKIHTFKVRKKPRRGESKPAVTIEKPRVFPTFQAVLPPIILIRVVVGSLLITTGLVGLVIPVMPGVLFIALGLSIGIIWHPKGLALWRRMKAGFYRFAIKLCGRRKTKPHDTV